MTLWVGSSLTHKKEHYSLWIGVTSDSVHNMGAQNYTNMFGILVHNITDWLQTAADLFD